MGNLYRFIEPVVLQLLLEKGTAHGYELAMAVARNQLTDSEVDRGAVYRTLRLLEEVGHVTSNWEIPDTGPARRAYRLTESGLRHLEEWHQVLERLSESLRRLVDEGRALMQRRGQPANRTQDGS